MPSPAFLSKTVSYGAIAAILLVFTGCATVPHSTTQAPVTLADLGATQTLQGEASATWPAQDWWQSFNDPQLNGLMDEAFAHAPDIKAAQARLEKAQAFNQQVTAALQPDASFNASAVSTKQSYNMGFPAAFAAFLPQGYQNQTRVTLDAKYDIDLWGKAHAAVKGALGEQNASRIEAEVARQNVAIALTRAYVELDRLYSEQEDLALLQKGADIGLQLEQARFDHHLDAKDILLSARDYQAQVASRSAAVNGAIRIQGYLISALAGLGPDRGQNLTRPQLTTTTLQGLPTDVPVNLLGRRPDIAAARLRVEAMGQQIKYSRADFYPNLNISAYWGEQALSKGGFQNAFKSGSDIGGIGPAFSLPLFHQGRLNAEYHSSEADYDQAVATYDQTLTSALQQVADAAASTQTTQAQIASAQARVDAAQETYDLTKARFSKGMNTTIDVLTAHSHLLSAQIDRANLKAQAFDDRLSLIAALGGGFQPE